MEKVIVVSSSKTAGEALLDFLRGSFKCTPKIVFEALVHKVVIELSLLKILRQLFSSLMDRAAQNSREERGI